jgi:aspartyl-tRNA(Asn)/glutamyl-tRNA(Gln) amidotransferase subunit B
MRLFISASQETSDHLTLSKWCVNEIPKNLTDETSHLSGASVAKLVELVSSGTVSSHSAKEIMTVLATTGRDLEEIVSEDNYKQIHNPEELQYIVSEVIESNPTEVQKYLDGKTEILGYLVGRVMKITSGSAEPKKTKELLETSLRELS